jgi:hypothetical protein
MSDYTVVIVQKGATVHKCELCGSIVLDRMTHDLWHAVIGVVLDDAAEQET